MVNKISGEYKMKKIMLLAIAAIMIACVIGCNKSETPTAKVAGVPNSSVATVDGLNITKTEYQTLLHNNYGRQALAELCETKIMEAWAKEEGVEPTKEQIDKEIQKLKDDGQYEDAVEELGEENITNMIKDQILKANLSKKIIPPSEEDMKQAFEYNKDKYKHGPRKLAFVVLGQDKASVDKLYKEIESMTDSAAIEKKVKELAKEYKDDPEKQPRTGTLWIGDETTGAPEDLLKVVKDLKVGDKSKVSEMTAGDNKLSYFVVIKKEEGAADKKFEEVKEELEDQVALMNSMSKPEFRDALQKRKEKAEITIKIEKFQDIADMIKQPVPPMNGPMPAPAPAPKAEKK